MVGGIGFDPVTERDVVSRVIAGSVSGVGGWVVTPNVDFLSKIARDCSLVSLLDDATLVVCDGSPLMWAARLAGSALPERVTGSSLIWSLSAAAARDGRSVYLLGGLPGTAERAAEQLRAAAPGLVVAGTDCPPLGFEKTADGIDRVRTAIGRARPDVVFCGLGFPKQEYLIVTLRAAMPGTWFIGCGGALAMAAGDVGRAPRWMQRIGAEWLHRLACEPRRMFRRYLVDDLPVALRLLAGSLRQRMSERGAVRP